MVIFYGEMTVLPFNYHMATIRKWGQNLVLGMARFFLLLLDNKVNKSKASVPALK
jgi:hypothetical protein